MKLAPQKIATFLRNPGETRVVLLHGDDAGMIRQRADDLVRTVAGSLADPFLVVDLAHGDIESLADEAASLSLTGGRRVVRVREATDRVTGPIQRFLELKATALVVLEASGIATRSKIRILLESSSDAATIACYAESGKELAATIRRVLGEANVAVDRDVLPWLLSQLGADQMSTRAELEKLILYVGRGGTIDLDAAMVCIGDVAGLSLDDAMLAAIGGDPTTADRALELALAGGLAPVGVLRGSLMYLQRMYKSRWLMETGLSAGDAANTLRPPIFFRHAPGFVNALNRWTIASLILAMAGMSNAEHNCKRTGAPDQTLSRHAILTVARRATTAR